jgi:hypothetical protein
MLPTKVFLLLSKTVNLESSVVGYTGIPAPSHGIRFNRITGGISGNVAGIFAYGVANSGGGLIFQTYSGIGNPTGFGTNTMILQPDNRVAIGLTTASEQLHVSGRIRSDLGFFSGSNDLGNVFYFASNPNGYLTSATVGGVRTLSVTGLSYSGNLTLTGLGGLTVTATGSTIYFSGQNNFLLLSNTGNFIGTNQTGNFVGTNQTGIFVTTQQQSTFTTSISTGIDNVFVSFPFTFSAAPKIQATVEVTGDILYAVAVRSRTVSGYTAIFSDIVLESGVVLHTLATTN